MPDALALLGARTPAEKHCWNSRDKTRRDDKAGGGIREPHRPYDLRQPQIDAVSGNTEREVGNPKRDYARVAQGGPKIRPASRLLSRQARSDCFLLRLR